MWWIWSAKASSHQIISCIVSSSAAKWQLKATQTLHHLKKIHRRRRHGKKKQQKELNKWINSRDTTPPALVWACVCTSYRTAVVLLAAHKQCDANWWVLETSFWMFPQWNVKAHQARLRKKKPFHASVTLKMLKMMPNNYTDYIFRQAGFEVWISYIASS